MNTQTSTATTAKARVCAFTRPCLSGLFLLSLAATATDSSAKFQPTHPAGCSFQVSDLDINGKPLTYEQAARLRDAHTVASTGAVHLPPVTLPNGREAAFVVEKNGCLRLVQVLGLR